MTFKNEKNHDPRCNVARNGDEYECERLEGCKHKRMKTHNLTISYGTSRGRDTYGYTLVTLRENGTKKASACGGGYDMRGTVFANWLEAEYQTQLLELARKETRVFPQSNWNGSSGDESNYVSVPVDRKTELYGGTYYANGSGGYDGEKDKPPHVSLEGGCGFSSIQRIAEAIGLTVNLINAGKNSDVIVVTETREAA